MCIKEKNEIMVIHEDPEWMYIGIKKTTRDRINKYVYPGDYVDTAINNLVDFEEACRNASKQVMP